MYYNTVLPLCQAVRSSSKSISSKLLNEVAAAISVISNVVAMLTLRSIIARRSSGLILSTASTILRRIASISVLARLIVCSLLRCMYYNKETKPCQPKGLFVPVAFSQHLLTMQVFFAFFTW